MKKYMTVEMPDKTLWAIPTEVIARNRAEHYAYEFDGDIEESLSEDTLPLFEQDEYEITDWAVNNMNWDDVEGHAIKIERDEDPDYQAGWMKGKKSFTDDLNIEAKAVLTIKQAPSEQEGKVAITASVNFYPPAKDNAPMCHRLAIKALEALTHKGDK